MRGSWLQAQRHITCGFDFQEEAEHRLDGNDNLLLHMRYDAHHKERTRHRIIENASRQFRAKGVNGPGVVKLMKASGLTQGGFYKHFASRDDLLAEAIRQSFREVGKFIESAGKKPGEAGWRAIVRQYLSLEHCQHPETGCPMAALAPDIARVSPSVKKRISGSIKEYRDQFVPWMPGKNLAEKKKNFRVIFSVMLGAIMVARTLPDETDRKQFLASVRDDLLARF